MSEQIPCPDCGHLNPAGSESCEACNFPLAAESHKAADAQMPPEPERSRTEAGRAIRGAGPVSFNPMPPRRKPRRRRRSTQALPIWLMVASVSAVAVVLVAIMSNVERASKPVEGSTPQQQVSADEYRAALAADSTDVHARIGLANVLYDTGNWSEAIVQYERAIAQDSSHVGPIVDLGVCYYNLGDADQAERHFKLALTKDPHQPVALFNLGIVYEGRGNWDEALQYFHRALESGPPDSMRDPLMAAIKRVAERAGKSAPPLPEGAK